MSECTHDCSSCGENCSSRKESMKEKLNDYSRVGKVIGVVSGKGGVGKSMVTSLLSVYTNRLGYNTAILDADVTGPSIPAVTKTGIQVMSLNLLLPNETDPVVWRGPVIAGVVKQFWTDVVWNDVDFMYVDMPPGTGDVPLTGFQSLPIDGIVVVTSPQELVGMIVEKAVNMARLMNVPVLGIVENFSTFKCPDCGKVHSIFGESRIDEIAARHDIDTVCRLPIDPVFAASADAGTIELSDETELVNLAKKITENK